MNLQTKKSVWKSFFILVVSVTFLLLGTVASFSQSGSGEIVKNPKSPKSKTKNAKTSGSQRKTQSKADSSERTARSTAVKAIVIALKANFRIYPSNDANSLGTVDYGEVLLVLDSKHVNGWYNVRHIQTNITGWVYGNTIKFIK